MMAFGAARVKRAVDEAGDNCLRKYAGVLLADGLRSDWRDPPAQATPASTQEKPETPSPLAAQLADDAAGPNMLPTLSPSTPPGSPLGIRQIETKIGQPPFELGATWTIPDHGGPFPAVVLIHGSGPSDRDETVVVNKPFRDLALQLGERGIASLRFDKRTYAHAKSISLETAVTMTVEDEVIADALAAITAVRQHPEVNERAIFVIGHSLGARLTPEIVQRDGRVAGAVLLAAPARPLPEMILEQMVVAGARADQIAAARAKADRLAAGMMGPTELFFGASAHYLDDLERRAPPVRARMVGKPLLFIWGERDYQVTGKDRQIWQRALQGVSKVSIQTFPRLNHLMIAGDGPPGPAEYQTPGVVDSSVVDAIATFVTATVATQRQ
jgi:dienelactone hydrolase